MYFWWPQLPPTSSVFYLLYEISVIICHNDAYDDDVRNRHLENQSHDAIIMVMPDAMRRYFITYTNMLGYRRPP